MKTYRAGDFNTVRAVRQTHELDEFWGYAVLRFVGTGEFREPKAGEYYLSGAIGEAYVTRVDLSTKYHIAKPAYIAKQATTEVLTPLKVKVP